MLLRAIKMQVETRLESSLHNRVYIIPDKDKNPSQVKHPWNIDVKSGSKPKFRLPQNTHIINVFDQPGIEGRLLILGQPGAGKTTMLLELAQKLVERAENDLNEPVPILLSLSSWQNDQQSIKDWIITELNSGKYYKVRKDITRKWLEEGEIIPLLDGLDELAASRQEQCVRKLNEFLQPGNWMYPLVVCSRIEEYQKYSTQLALNTSLELQPFSDEQIQEYLRRTGNEQLGNSIKDDQELRQLAQTPLFLNIIVLSCQKLSLDKWKELESSAERIDYLLSTYVEEMLERGYDGKRPSDKKTKRWLGWLARNLIKQNETEIFIERMQTTWLDNGREKQLRQLYYLEIIWGLIGLMVGLFFGLRGGLIIGLVGTVYVSLFFIAILMPLHSFKIETVEIIRFNFIQFKNGLTDGLIKGLVDGLESSETKTKTNPNQGIWKSFQNAIFILILGLILGLIFGLILGLILGLIFGLSRGLIGGLYIGLIGGLYIGFMVGIERGGKACIQHLSLRLILYHNGHIPWNYARFLDYATDRLFLQRVGGSYRFMHDLLRQHFATNYR